MRIAHWSLVTLVLGLSSAALVCFALRASADGAPTTQPLWYAGTVRAESGEPLTGNHDVWLRLYPEQVGSSAACSSGPLSVPFVDGRFRVELSSDCVAIMRSTPELFVELSVDDANKPFPRSKVGAVPYALEAARAVSANEAAGNLKQAIDSIPKVTAWQDFSAQVYFDATQAAFAPSDARGKYRRVGDSIEAQYEIKAATITGAGRLSFALPDGLQPELSKLVTWAQMGHGVLYSSAQQFLWLISVEVEHDSGRVQLVYHNPTAAGALVTTSSPFDMTSGFSSRFTLTMPIRGWTVSGS